MGNSNKQPVRDLAGLLRLSTCAVALGFAVAGWLAVGPAAAVQLAQADAAQPAEPATPPADAEQPAGLPPEAGDDGGSLSGDIEELQEQIDTESEAEQAKAESRQKVAALISQADKLADAGDLAGAEALLEQARQVALPDDALTRNRVALALVTIKIRRGDLAGASGMLDQLTGSDTLTETEKARIEQLKQRLEAAVTDADRQAIVAEITALADQAAIEKAQLEAARDPGNFGVRLVLGDLLRKVGRLAEAAQVGEALLADTTSPDHVGVHQRALVLLGRVACDRKDFAAALEYLELLRATGETPQKAQRVADLEARIAKLEARAADAEANAERKAAIDEILALTGQAAIDRAQEVVKADPGNLSARLLLGDLLRKAGRFAEAQAVAEALLADTNTAETLGVHQRGIVLLGRIAADRGDFAAARGFLDTLRASGETPQKAQRVSDLEQYIAKAQTRAAEQVAEEAGKARQRAEKERIAAENARLDAELAGLEELSGEEALARARALHEANPDNGKIANAYARLLAREGFWDEAEAIYLAMTGSLDSASGSGLVEQSSAVFGLVDLYSRTNRLALANQWLTRLEGAYGVAASTVPERAGLLRSRVDTALRPDQITASLTLGFGYNSNVSAPSDDQNDDTLDTFLPSDVGSTFFDADARFRYDRVVTPNGDKLRLQARMDERAYLEVDDADRMSLEINGGYVYYVPASQTEIQALVGYRSRFVDYDSYRRTVYGLVNVDTDFTQTLGGVATFIVEGNDDDDPDRDGVAVDGYGRLRYELTDRDIATLGFEARYEDADLQSESRTILTPSISFRHAFDIGSMTDFYAFASYYPSFTRYGGPLTGGVDAGVTREDWSHKVSFGIGREVSPNWRFEIGGSYYRRNSNVEAKDKTSTEVMFSITRQFSNQ